MCLHAGIVGVLTCWDSGGASGWDSGGASGWDSGGASGWDSGGAHVCLHAGIVEVHVCAYMLRVVEVQTSAQEVLHINPTLAVVDISILVLIDTLCLPSLLLQ